MSNGFETLVVYAGYPKTGSQWLLHSLWNSEFSGFALAADVASVARAFISNNPFEFRPRDARSLCEASVDRCVSRGVVPVLHHEGIAADLFKPMPPNLLPFQQLADAFPGCRIILAVREQRGMILSWYAHNVRLGLGASLDEYLDEIQPGITPFVRLDLFAFDIVVSRLYEMFGKSNVLVLPYELMKADIGTYVDAIYQFCQEAHCGKRPNPTAHNVGLSAIETWVVSKINRWLHSERPVPRPVGRCKAVVTKMARGVCRGVPASVSGRVRARFERVIDERIGSRYHASNRRLEELTGLDLRQYNYKVE